MRIIRFTSIIAMLTVFISTSLTAQWQQDFKYGFKINIPSDWNKNSYMDGTDQVYDYMSADENIAIQLRAFKAGEGFTTELLVQVYEESMLPAGTQKLSLNNHITATGIPSKKGVYLIDYNGNEVGLSALYIVQNNNGYVLTAHIPTGMIQQRGEELKRVVKSFSIDGFVASTNTAKQNNEPSGLSSLTGSVASSSFKITGIKLSNKVDANNHAINPTTTFNPQTSEILAVVVYNGGTQKDLVVSWIFNDWDRTISSDVYNFTDKKGGIGIISITKPNTGWPVGSYSVKFEMDGKVIRELGFTVSEQSSAIAGKYNLAGRSDGKSLVDYHFIDLKKDGTYWEEYSPKDSGGYVSENAGTWKVVGNQLTLTQRYGGVSDSYTINGSKLIRTSSDGTIFTFRK